MDATDKQQDHLKSLGVRTIPKDLAIGAASEWIDELSEEETDEERDEGTGSSDFARADPYRYQVRNWRITRWIALLLATLGIGWLVYELVKASDPMLR